MAGDVDPVYLLKPAVGRASPRRQRSGPVGEKMGLGNFQLPLSSDPIVNSLILWDWQRPSPWPADGRLDYAFMQTDMQAAVLGGSATAMSGVAAFGLSQMAATQGLMTYVGSVIGLPVAQAASDSLTADIYFATADLSGSTAGVAYYVPGLAPAFVYMDNSNVFDASMSTFAYGSAAYEVLLHEVGHAIGLDHPFEGPYALPAGTDNTSVSIMSYTDVGGPHTTFQEWDLRALQYLYGSGSVVSSQLTEAADVQTLSDGVDLVSGLGGDDVVSGMGGNDIIYGNTGNDILYGNLGDDSLFGGQGSDAVFGGQGADRVYGNLAADLMYGNMADDWMHGGQGADTLYGGQGADTLAGGTDDDVLFGNLGADVYVFGAGMGQDVVYGFAAGEGDRIQLAGGTFYTVTADAAGNAAIVVDTARLILSGVAAGSVEQSWFV